MDFKKHLSEMFSNFSQLLGLGNFDDGLPSLGANDAPVRFIATGNATEKINFPKVEALLKGETLDIYEGQDGAYTSFQHLNRVEDALEAKGVPILEQYATGTGYPRIKSLDTTGNGIVFTGDIDGVWLTNTLLQELENNLFDSKAAIKKPNISPQKIANTKPAANENNIQVTALPRYDSPDHPANQGADKIKFIKRTSDKASANLLNDSFSPGLATRNPVDSITSSKRETRNPMDKDYRRTSTGLYSILFPTKSEIKKPEKKKKEHSRYDSASYPGAALIDAACPPKRK